MSRIAVSNLRPIRTPLLSPCQVCVCLLLLDQTHALQDLIFPIARPNTPRLEYDVPVEHLVFGTTTQRDVVAAVLRAGAPQQMVANSLASIVRRSSMYGTCAYVYDLLVYAYVLVRRV